MTQAARPRCRTLGVLTLAVLVLSSCGDATPSASIGGASSPLPVSSPAPPTAPVSPSLEAATPSPTAVPLLDIGTLPAASPNPATLTALCDPEASQGNLKAGEATISCDDGLVLGLRALETVVTEPIERIYFRRPACRATPCTADELSTATVTGWSADAVFSVVLDSRLTTVTTPSPDPAAVWPSGGSSAAPAVKRPVIKGAPREVVTRTPYPFCGSAVLNNPSSAFGCFRDAVLARRPAEFIDHVYGTEGGAITWLYRFDGRGALLRYTGEAGVWSREAGTMILGITRTAWDFSPW